MSICPDLDNIIRISILFTNKNIPIHIQSDRQKIQAMEKKIIIVQLFLPPIFVTKLKGQV